MEIKLNGENVHTLKDDKDTKNGWLTGQLPVFATVLADSLQACSRPFNRPSCCTEQFQYRCVAFGSSPGVIIALPNFHGSVPVALIDGIFPLWLCQTSSTSLYQSTAGKKDSELLLWHFSYRVEKDEDGETPNDGFTTATVRCRLSVSCRESSPHGKETKRTPVLCLVDTFVALKRESTSSLRTD